MLAKLSSFLTTFSTNVARCFLSTKSCTVAGRSIGSSIFQARNVLLMRRTESDSRASGQRKAVLFSYTLPACCIDFSDGLLAGRFITSYDLEMRAHPYLCRDNGWSPKPWRLPSTSG